MLNPHEYEHEYDKMALDSLNKIPGLKIYSKFYLKYDIEKQYKILNTGSSIKVTPTHFPEIHQILEEACRNIHLTHIPDLYIQRGWEINASTTGREQPLIMISSGAVEYLTSEELLCVVGHEAGHIKSGHTLYSNMARTISMLGESIIDSLWGIGGYVQSNVEQALNLWSQMSEFTSDRAGLLACQDKEVAISVLMKLSGVPPKLYDKMDTGEFIEQASEFKSFDSDALDKMYKEYFKLGRDHPWGVLRASEILKWADEGKYQHIIDIHSEENIDNIDETCLECGNKLKSDETFCGICGSKRWEQICPKCGNQIKGDEGFCGECGKKLWRR
jgi:Zn-dependent protease with chaperone function